MIRVKGEVLPKACKGSGHVVWIREAGKNAIRMRAMCNKDCYGRIGRRGCAAWVDYFCILVIVFLVLESLGVVVLRGVRKVGCVCEF